MSKCVSHNGAGAGKVWLVGAGPGDPDLLTVKALKCIQNADLILFDALISREIHALFPKHIPAFYVGKKKDAHSISQKELNKLLIRKAKEGKQVCRLKAGDPFVFGRGGEELIELRRAGIRAEVVPGITAASGCASAAGIPLTHRGITQGCTFVTGHGETDLNLDWRALAALGHTLVFYMGLTNAPLIQSALIQHGLAPSTPVAIIENGCTPSQRVGKGCLKELHTIITNGAFVSPSLIVIGDTVSLSELLSSNKQILNENKDMECQKIYSQRLSA